MTADQKGAFAINALVRSLQSDPKLLVSAGFLGNEDVGCVQGFLQAMAAFLLREIDRVEAYLAENAGENSGSRSMNRRATQSREALEKRATWLEGAMTERGLTSFQVEKQGGPDRKTVAKVLRRELIRDKKWERIRDVVTAQPIKKVAPKS